MSEENRRPGGAPVPQPAPATPTAQSSGRWHGQRDRWAHRRAEPRMLALVWTMYLLVATGLSFARVGLVEPVDVQVYRASARALLLSVAIGACALWPMVRLSQSRPRRPVWETFKDLLVIVAPMQAVIWGQALLSGWRPGALAAVSVGLGAWTAICGGLLAMALAAPGRLSAGRRVGGMAAVLVVTCAGGVVILTEGLGARTGLLTPYTVPWAVLGRDLSLGYTLGPTSGQWGAALGLCLAAGAPWLVAGALGGVGGARREGRRRKGHNNGPLAEPAPKR